MDGCDFGDERSDVWSDVEARLHAHGSDLPSDPSSRPNDRIDAASRTAGSGTLRSCSGGVGTVGNACAGDLILEGSAAVTLLDEWEKKHGDYWQSRDDEHCGSSAVSRDRP